MADGNILLDGTWYALEFHFKISDADGIMQAKANGVLALDYSGDTKPGADTTLDNIYILAIGSSGRTQYYDDIAINDTTGSVDNSWCGDGRIIAIKPNANGDVTGLLNSAGNQTNNYTYVDDIPSDGDTTFVSGSEVDLYDLYGAESPTIPTGYIPKGFWVEGRAKTTGSGIMSPMLKTSGSEITSGSVALGYEYAPIIGDYYSSDPITSGSWSQETLDAIQIGVKISGSGV